MKSSLDYSPNVFKTLAMAYRPYKHWLLIIAISGFLGRGFILYNANIMGQWADALIKGNAFEPNRYLTLMGILVATGFVMTLFFRVGFSIISAKAVSIFYDETTLRASRFPMTFFDNSPVGRVVTRFSNDYGNVFRLFGGPLAEFLSIIFDLVCMLALMAYANWSFLPLALLFGGFQFLIYRRHKIKLRENRRMLSSSRSPSIAHFSETAQGANSIRSFNRQSSFVNRFRELDGVYLKNRMRTTVSVLQYSSEMNIMTGLLLGFTGVLCLTLGDQLGISLGSIGVAFGMITLSGQTLLNFFEWLAQVEEALVGVERMDSYLRKEIEPGSFLPDDVKFKTDHPKHKNFKHLAVPDLQKASVEFKNLSFRYSKDTPWILKDLSFCVQAGEKFGIIGRTGSGKSSLTQALLQLYPIEQGEILVQGLSPALKPGQFGLSLPEYRRLFSYISQDPILFRGRLRENLDLENRYDDQELYKALKAVDLNEWANPNGLNRIIEEKGRNLSVGEKQLICLARSMIRPSPVVIMDEATSSIDPRSEEDLVQTTQRIFKDRTQIIIAHRLSTLADCDRILWLNEGQIKKIGPASEVLKEFNDFSISQV